MTKCIQKTVEGFPWLSSLSDEQRAAAIHHKGPSLTLAVPGSGKTTLMIHRVLHLILAHGIAPGSILSLTFSKAAATDMSNRFEQLAANTQMPPNGAIRNNEAPVFSTIHAFAYRLIRQQARQSGLPAKSVISDSDQMRLLHQLMQHLRLPYEGEDDIDTLRNAISRISNLDLPLEQDHGDKRVVPLFTAYTRYKEDKNLLDFDDMILFADRLLEGDPNLCNRLSATFRYIQMDEAQDTSALQHRFIRRLLGSERNLFMVADDDQSIYGFRGADPSQLLAFHEEFPSGSVHTLATNYRSAPEIIHACSAFIDLNTNRYAKDFQAHRAPGGQMILDQFDTTTERNQWIVSFCTSTQQPGNTTAILYRNHLSAVPIAAALSKAGIPFRISDPCRSFFHHWAVKDLCELLDFALFSNDQDTFKKHYYKLNLFISKQVVESLPTFGGSLFDNLRSAYRGSWQIKNIDRLEQQLAMIRSSTPYTGIRLILNEMGYLQYVTKRTERTSTSNDTIGWIIEGFLDIIRDCRTIADALMTLSQLEDTLRESTGDNGATTILSTLHASKGLEFDNVLLVDINKDVIPAPFIESRDHVDRANGSPKSKGLTEEESHLEEERRLFYVGMSRSKHSLHLVRHKFCSGAYVAPSPFLAEVESHFKKIHHGSADVLESSKKATFPSKEEIASLYDIEIGCLLKHEKFGEGRLVDIEGDFWWIHFDDGTKKLSGKILLENALIRVLK